ncbi:hypothetical protein BC829DRAFT_164138 [Chytridium lagenaria]|nr:hypothetical protein BC829DRAFT_164138 [Chytridium lagenaria]
MENLPSKSLTELNLKRNQVFSVVDTPNFMQITAITGAQTLHALRRLVIGCNHVGSFECIADLLFASSLSELSMETNPINSDEFYRAILVNRIKTLRVLDGKRVSDEERRHAAKIAKREAERRKENDKNIVLSEEKKKAINQIQSRWESDQAIHRAISVERSKESNPENSAVNKAFASRFPGNGKPKRLSSIIGDEVRYHDGNNSFVQLQNGVLNIYGDALAFMEKIDPTRYVE